MESMTVLPTAPLEFHRLARLRPRFRWWRMLVTGVVALALYAAMLLALSATMVVASLTDPRFRESIDELFVSMTYFDLDAPWLMLGLLVPLILMIPALQAASRMIEGRGTGLLISVLGRMRWRWLGRTMLMAFPVLTAMILLSVGIGHLTGTPVEPLAAHPGIPLMLIIVVLLVPFQAAAEEYVFRGYLMQLVGGWLRHPAFAILLPVPLFVIGHDYDMWGMIAVGGFAVVAGWLCWRTGGLEAAISMHVANNVMLFVLASFGLLDANAKSGTPLDVAIQLAGLVIFTLLVVRSARTHGIERTAPVVPYPPQAAVSASASTIV